MMTYLYIIGDTMTQWGQHGFDTTAYTQTGPRGGSAGAGVGLICAYDCLVLCWSQ